MSHIEKTAIVYAGGGMRSAHGAGFLYALGQHFSTIRPDIFVGSSGATGNIFYFIAGQHECAKPVWNDVLLTSRFISLIRFWRIMDIDYLVNDVFKKQFPLDTAALAQSPIQYFIPLLDTANGTVRYIGKEDAVDPFALLRASKSMPFFYGKSTPLAGRFYMDGGVAVTVEDMVRCAKEHGAKRILVIDNRTHLNAIRRAVLFLYAYVVARKAVRKALLQWMGNHRNPFDENGVKYIFIQPKINMFTATRNPKKIRALFQMGIDDALARAAELRTLFT